MVPLVYFSATIPGDKYRAAPICLFFPLSAPFVVALAYYMEYSLVSGRKEIDDLKSMTYSYHKP